MCAPSRHIILIPIFADVDETYNMDPADVEDKITDRTAVVVRPKAWEQGGCDILPGPWAIARNGLVELRAR